MLTFFMLCSLFNMCNIWKINEPFLTVCLLAVLNVVCNKILRLSVNCDIEVPSMWVVAVIIGTWIFLFWLLRNFNFFCFKFYRICDTNMKNRYQHFYLEPFTVLQVIKRMSISGRLTLFQSLFEEFSPFSKNSCFMT